MNTAMWLHPATQANVATLRQRGHLIIEPDSGLMACGTEGPGRLPEPRRIADIVIQTLTRRHDLDNETVLITAGPTREPLDPVRYISNRSSGKMGYALAEAAALRGARVVLVSGPVSIPAPEGVELVPVQTALEMRQAVLDHLAGADIVIKAAAVADYYVAHTPKQKVKKTAMRMSLELEPTPDILAEVGAEIRRSDGHQLLVGFAAETENVVIEARRKLQAKGCDMIVANDVSGAATGFDSDDNEVVLVDHTGATVHLARASKRVLAHQILDAVLKLRLTPRAGR
jgi:phosphopantothenoylcysteine decarboxylase/phosphopantothenate--cysteine ligase